MIRRTSSAKNSGRAAFTLVELMVASSVGMMVLAAVSFMSLYASRSSIAVINYTDLEAKSRYALDVISRELRQASQVLSYQSSATLKSLTLTNADQGASIVLTYDPAARTLALNKTGQASMTVLTECDRWDFGLYQRTPLVTSTNVFYYPATNSAGTLDPRICKLINLSWKCSRLVAAQKLNTESVQAAQFVLRNKQ
jgi:type II secretory pathway component PulJ